MKVQPQRRWRRLIAWVGGLLLLGLLVPFLEPLGIRLRPHFPGQSARDQLRAERSKLTPPEDILKVLRLEPGMTVLDLGAGWGFFTFPIARAVGAKGKVFATEVDPAAVRFLNAEARRTQVANVAPVWVRRRGLDPFYLQHTFDVVFVFDVFPFIPDATDFFRQLGPALPPERGRLWIFVSRLEPDFTSAELGDCAAVLDAFRSEGLRSPLVKHLRPETREALAGLQSRTVPERVRSLIVDDLNRLLEDATFWPDIQPRAPSLTRREEPVRRYLLERLTSEGVFDPGLPIISPPGRQWLRVLNRLILKDLLETEVWERALALDKMSSSDWKKLLQFPLAVPPPSVLKTAGYDLVREYWDLNYLRIWEFKRAR